MNGKIKSIAVVAVMVMVIVGAVAMPVSAATGDGSITVTNDGDEQEFIIYDDTGSEVANATINNGSSHTFDVPGDADYTVEANLDLAESSSFYVGVDSEASLVYDGVGFSVTPGWATISGTVADSEGNPIEGASVWVYDSNDNPVYDTTTGVDGTYSTSGTSGDYTIEVSHSDYLDRNQSVTHNETESTVENITLGTIDVVIDAPAEPVVDESFELNATDTSHPYGFTFTNYEWDFDGDGTTDATGLTTSHTYTSVGVQTIELTVTDDDGNTATGTVSVSVVEATYPVTFNITDSNETAMENATVEVLDANDTVVSTLSTGTEGTAVADLADGDYTYSVTFDGYDTESGNFTVSGASETVDVTLSETTTTTTDDGSGGGFVPSDTSYAIVLLLILIGAAVVLGKEDESR